MNPAELERFREVEEIFYAAIEWPAGAERDNLVRARCGGDEGLRAEVALLLADHEHIRAAVPAPAQRLPRFGAWQAVKLLGRGGMGTVYLAERADGAFQMSAAVKVVPLALASHEIEERFRRERQFLASLDHPKVARLIDGGVSEIGLPYLVMEFVGGLAIDAFCEAHRLDTRSRVALARQVLEALAYVHGRNVIHRDAKPSNILVDESGSVKLLDFGTARLVDATAEAALTKSGVFAFTPEYASPEQVRGEPVTAASDLYSAGVLLYRLLTGRLPYRITDPSPAAAAKAIAGAQPEASGLEAPLAAILAKALRKDSADRYQSAAEMDADLGRYLEGQRVHAPPPRGKYWAALAAVMVGAGAILMMLLRAPPNAGALVPFDPGVPNAMQPALSRDGKWLAFASRGAQGTRPDIWMKPMPRGAPRRVTTGEANDEPSLSPDGAWLAFHSTRAPAGVYVQPAGGGAARLLAEGGRSPRFSPDGKWIAYLNTSESGGDVLAPNTRMLFRVPAQGGAPVRLAHNVSAVQGLAWSPDSRGIYVLALGEELALRLWNAPLDGGAATLTSGFSEPVHVDARACAVSGGRFLYSSTGDYPRLSEFLLQAPVRGNRYRNVAAPAQQDITGCTASADGMVLADAVDSRSSAWTLPIDPETGRSRGSLTPLALPERGSFISLNPDGSACLWSAGQASFLQDLRSGARRPMPGAEMLSSDGAFVVRAAGGATRENPVIRSVLNLNTSESWGGFQGNGAGWDLSRGGQWMLTVGPTGLRTIVAWDTHTAEHQVIYSHPTANLYLANLSKDGQWTVFTSEEGDAPPHMWAAPFRGLRDVPPAQWVDLGEGDYPRWSSDGRRIFFTQVHDGFECLFSRAVDPLTKRPAGPVIEVHHFHNGMTPAGIRPGYFRISVARDKLAFMLGERTHQLFAWR